MSGGPIFIVGAMGSGTTLLRLMLDSHESIAIPQETGFMRAYDAHRFTPFKASGRNWTKRLGWSVKERDELLRDLYEKLFMRYAEQHGKQRWGEKTPIHTWHIDDIAHLFPDAQFIGVIRHPSASVASNMSRFNLRLRRSWRHWKRYTDEIARQAARYGDRFAVIRYEDLVVHPEPVMRELLEWLGEPWSDSVLAHHSIQGSRAGRAKVEGKTRRDEPIDPSRVGKWQTTMRPQQRRWVAKRTRRRAKFYGYSMKEALPVAPLSSSGGHVVLGTEVDARIDAHPQLDLRAERPAPVYDGFFDPREVMVLRRKHYERLMRERRPQSVRAAVVQAVPERPRGALLKLARRLPGRDG